MTILTKQNAETVDHLKLQMETYFGDRILATEVFRGEIAATIAFDNVPTVLAFLREENGGGFTQLTELTAVDYPSRDKRFDLIYQLLSVRHNRRIRLKAAIGDGEVAPSVSHLFSSAIWSEREVWDMFGIFFSGHPDLRRLLTDYGFEGHPLRKDFPLMGTVETRYDENEGRVIYEPVAFNQEFRNFDYTSPWEGIQTAMRRDDKPVGDSKD